MKIPFTNHELENMSISEIDRVFRGGEYGEIAKILAERLCAEVEAHESTKRTQVSDDYWDDDEVNYLTEKLESVRTELKKKSNKITTLETENANLILENARLRERSYSRLSTSA